MDTLAVLPASQASINQRAGRAGRTAPGKCFRLFTEATLTSLPKSTPPEICRTDISFLVLQLKALGIDNVLRFDFLTPPPSAMLSKALEFLFNLGALDKTGQLTKPLGTQMAEMPVDPMLAKILLDSPTYQCSDEILTMYVFFANSFFFLIAALMVMEQRRNDSSSGQSSSLGRTIRADSLNSQNVFLMGERGDSVQGELERRKFTVEEGDHLTLLNTFMAFQQNGRSSAKWCASHKLNFKALSRAVSIRQQLSKYLKRFDLPILSSSADEDGSTAIRQCLAAGYFRNAAKVQHDGTYRSIPDGIILHTHPSSVLFTRTPPTGYVIYHEVVETTKRFIRDITVVDPVSLGNFYRGWDSPLIVHPLGLDLAKLPQRLVNEG